MLSISGAKRLRACLFLLSLHLPSLFGAPWLMDGDKPVPGTFIGMEKGKMVFEFENRRRGALELSRLNPQSLDELRQWYSEKKTTAEGLVPPLWSARDGIRGVALKKKSAGPKTWIFESPHFIFELDAPIDAFSLRRLATIAEATFNRVNSLPIRIPPAPDEKNRILIFKEQASYLKAGGNEITAARFVGISKDRRGTVIATFGSVGLTPGEGPYRVGAAEASRILVHEIGHQLTAEYIWFLPTWLNEGFAEYVAFVPCSGGFFDSSPSKRLAGIRNRIAFYERMDLNLFGPVSPFDQGGGDGNKKGSEIGDWLVPLEDLLAERDIIQDSIRNGDLRKAHSSYLTSMLLTYYFLHLEGDRQGSSIRALFEETGDLQEILAKRPPLVTRVGNPRTREELNVIIQKLMEDFMRKLSPKEIQDDMVARYRKLGIALPFPR